MLALERPHTKELSKKATCLASSHAFSVISSSSPSSSPSSSSQLHYCHPRHGGDIVKGDSSSFRMLNRNALHALHLCRAAFSLSGTASTSAAASTMGLQTPQQRILSALGASPSSSPHPLLSSGQPRSAADLHGFWKVSWVLLNQTLKSGWDYSQVSKHPHSPFTSTAVCVQASLHTAPTLCFAADNAGINPLQQMPGPAGAASPLSFVPEGAAAGSDARRTARAFARNLHISPRKLNMFASLIRGLHVEDALIQCRVSVKKSAKMCEVALSAARANAVNNHGLDGDKLRVGE